MKYKITTKEGNYYAVAEKRVMDLINGNTKFVLVSDNLWITAENIIKIEIDETI